MTTTPCFTRCGRDRAPGRYLCRACWFRLPSHTRRALNTRDSQAMTRLRTLHAQLTAGVPLAEIEVSP